MKGYGWQSVCGQEIPLATHVLQFSSVQFSSVSQSCLTLCDPMNRSMPGLPVHHICLVKAVYYFKLKALWKLMSDCCFFHRGKLRLQSEVLLRVTHRPVPHACCCPPRVARGVCCLAGVCATLSALVTLHILSCPILMTLYETGITGPISQMRERRHRKGK